MPLLTGKRFLPEALGLSPLCPAAFSESKHQEAADIEHVAGMDFWGSIQGMFQKRFHLTIDSEAKELNADDSEKRKLYLDKYRDEILNGHNSANSFAYSSTLFWISSTALQCSFVRVSSINEIADDSEKRKLYLDKYRDEILKQSRKERENYLP